MSSSSDRDSGFHPTGGTPSAAATGSSHLSLAAGTNGHQPPLPIVSLSSETPLPDLGPIGPRTAVPSPPVINASNLARLPGDGELWLDGDVLMCACPECGAPMTIRLWLMLASCWQCQTTIELTEEQEREAKRLLEERAHRGAPPVPAPQPPVTQPSVTQPSVTQSPTSQPPTPSPPPALRAVAPSAPARPRPSPPLPSTPLLESVPPRQPRAEPQPAAAARHVARAVSKRPFRLGDLLRMMPAWLISLLFHLIVLTLLGLITFGRDEQDWIVLSTIVHPARNEGGTTVGQHSEDEVDFDLPIPRDVDLSNPQQRAAMIREDQDARELRVDPSAIEPARAELAQVRDQIRSSSRSVGVAARDPRVRVEIVEQEGGTTLTEAAVARALRWLSRQQKPDGRWQLDGAIRSDTAATSLALLPFLGAGQTHLSGRYKDTVSRGLRWLIQQQKPNGDLRGDAPDQPGMYAQGQSAIVLCEAFLVTGDESLRVPAQRGIDFIVDAQYPDGGWRYRPNRESPDKRGDTSVFGWQLMALQSARAAGLTVPEETMELASRYLDGVQTEEGLYCYQNRNSPTPAMTAEALLCRMYLGATRAEPRLQPGVQYLVDNHLPKPGEENAYYWYYATQAMHHVGGPAWERWNLVMRDVLVTTQERSGATAGSWNPQSSFSQQGGRLYLTSLAACSLEVYYRHLPLFRQIKLD